MLGTITNVCTIVVGSIVGSVLKRGIRPAWQNALYNAMGLASLALGLNAVCRFMPQSEYPVLFVVSLALGGLIGTMLHIDERFNTFVNRVSKEETNGEQPSLAQGLSTGILLYCIGTLSILGPVNSALLGDNTYLYTNATLDLITSAVLAATYGIGMVWAALPLFLWQGSIYLIAILAGDVITHSLLVEMSTVGGTLIVGSGLALLKIKDCKTLNLLPALFIPPLFFLLHWLISTTA